MSRHQRATWIIDEAAERRRLASRAMLGDKPDIHEPDVRRAVGENLSRQPEKQSALAMLHRAPKEGARRTLRQGTAGA